MSNQPSEEEKQLGEGQEAGVSSSPLLSSSEQVVNELQSQPSSEVSSATAVRDEDILQGLVYPPPPSFYLKKPAPQQSIAASRPVSATISANESVQPLPFTPSFQAQKSFSPYSGPETGYLPPGQPPLMSVPPPPFVMPPLQKKSYTWIWILVCTIIVVVLGSCGLMAWVTYSIYGEPVRQTIASVTDSQDQTNAFFEALQAQNYPLAYSYLSPEGSISQMTQAQFVAQAQQQDQNFGPIQSFTMETQSNITFDNAAPKSFVIPVDVTRTHRKLYIIHLTFRKIGSSWKIVDFDAL